MNSPAPQSWSQRWSLQTVDQGVLAFDRCGGRNILVKNAGTAQLRRRAPRVLQIGLLTPCNLHCDFCYRDTSAPSRLTALFLLDLLAQAARWGVLEVAFGGGEPLLFHGFAELVEELHRTTPLGINFTTNGTLLTEDLLARLSKVVGEIRISAYADNHYRRTLRMARGMNVGVNWLVTPANAGMIEPYVFDFLSLGARNVLLLGYKGPDPNLHLRPANFERLQQAVRRLQHLPLRLDVCWHPRLRGVPHLFTKNDCGAGDEFLVITPDRAVQPCSFHHERIPFETFDDLTAIYADMQRRRASANVLGCTRSDFEPRPATEPAQGVWFWDARAGNNSGDWTIVGRFREAKDAQAAAEALRGLARAHEVFLASPEGQAALVANGYNGAIPTPPLVQFGEAHGFDWSKEDEGLWWEMDGCGAPVLTAGAVGNSVVVYHGYCMGLPEEPFRKYFEAVGAVEFGYWQYDRPMVIARARGEVTMTVNAVREHLAQITESGHDAADAPPWGAECAQLYDDESRSAVLARRDHIIEQQGDRLTLGLVFENTLAGALALSDWLKAAGLSDVTLSIEQPLQELAYKGQPVSPAANIFSGYRPLSDRLKGATNAEVIEVLFGYAFGCPEPLALALGRVPTAERVSLARAAWIRLEHEGKDVSRQALHVIEEAGPAAADWLRELWPSLAVKREFAWAAMRALKDVLPKEEAFRLAQAWLAGAASATDRKDLLQSFGELHHEGTCDLIEQWFATAPANEATLNWPTIAAKSEMKWPAIARWLRSGRPLSLIALGVLEQYAQHGLPPSYVRPVSQEFRQILLACKAADPAPRASGAVTRLLECESNLSVDAGPSPR